MKNKLAIFDLDGTLFNTEKVNYLSYKQALLEVGYSLDYDYYIRECNGKYYKDYLPLILPNITPQLMEEVHNRKKILYSSNLGSAIMNRHLFNIIDSIRREYYIALVTTASKANCKDILHHFKRYDSFELIITHNDVEKVKPDPEGFFKAMDYFGVSAEGTIIFEDSNPGIDAAKKTGAAIFTVANF